MFYRALRISIHLIEFIYQTMIFFSLSPELLVLTHTHKNTRGLFPKIKLAFPRKRHFHQLQWNSKAKESQRFDNSKFDRFSVILSTNTERIFNILHLKWFENILKNPRKLNDFHYKNLSKTSITSGYFSLMWIFFSIFIEFSV